MSTSYFVASIKGGGTINTAAPGASQTDSRMQSAGGMFIYMLLWLTAASPLVMAQPNSVTKPATSSLPASITTTSATTRPMTQIVPLWAGGYLHISDLSSLLKHLPIQLFNTTTRPSTTTKVHKPGQTPTSRSAAQLTAQIFGSGGSAFIENLLGKEFALAWGGWDKPDQFALICKPAQPAMLRSLLAGAQTRTPSSYPAATIYNTGSGQINLAMIDGMLIIGTIGRGTEPGMLHAILELIAHGGQKQSIVHRSEFAQRFEQLGADHDVFFYLHKLKLFKAGLEHDWRGSLAALLEQLRGIALAGRLTDDGVQLRMAAGLAKSNLLLATRQAVDLDQLLRLPQQAIMVYSTCFSPSPWYKHFKRLAQTRRDPVSSRYVAILEILVPDSALREALLETLGPQVTFLVMQTPKTSTAPAGTTKPAGTIPFPPLAMVVQIKDTAVTTEAINQAMAAFAIMLNLRQLQQDVQDFVAIQNQPYHGSVIHSLDISSIFARQGSNNLADKVTIAWSIVDNNLILATSNTAVEQIIDARKGLAANITQWLSLDKPMPNWPVELAVFLQPQELAVHLQHCLETIRQSKTGDTNFWQILVSQAASASRMGPILGIAASTDENQRAAVRVAAVLPYYPAHGKLEVDDYIIGVNGQALEPRDAKADLELKLRLISSTSATLDVIRNGQHLKVNVQFSGKDRSTGQNLINTLKISAKVMQHIHSGTLLLGREDLESLNATMTVKWAQHPDKQP